MRAQPSRAERKRKSAIEKTVLNFPGYIAWLQRDERFDPQSYQHLAAVLTAGGQSGKANEVLYAARQQERLQAVAAGETRHAGMLWTLEHGIGYGIGDYSFRVFRTVALFLLAGVLVLACAPKARDKGLIWMTGASLSHLLPFVDLNPEFKEFFNDPGRDRLKGWQLAYFAVHAMIGFVLGGVVIAAIGGLTQSK